jgi:hypothetical protein
MTMLKTRPGRHSLANRASGNRRGFSVLGIVRNISKAHPEREFTELRERIIRAREGDGYDTKAEWHMERELRALIAERRATEKLAAELRAEAETFVIDEHTAQQLVVTV